MAPRQQKTSVKKAGKGKKTKNIRSTNKKKVQTLVIEGYRKKAIGRGYVKEGNGMIRVNGKPLEIYFPNDILYRVKEPLFIAGEDKLNNLSIDITVRGGGITGQTDVVRQIIAKSLVEFYNDDSLKETFLKYDRSLLVPDPRQTEPHKPSRSKQGPRRKKQLSKR